MRFADFLRVTVLLSAGSATALATVAVVGADSRGEQSVVLLAIGWWVLAGAIGLRAGSRAEVNAQIARLLAGARAVTALPEPRPGPILLNRLWPLLAATLAAGALAFVYPQAAGVGAGFSIIWALSWRRQDAAVHAIEERDGVEFYVERTSPLRSISLLRTTGFQTIRPPAGAA